MVGREDLIESFLDSGVLCNVLCRTRIIGSTTKLQQSLVMGFVQSFKIVLLKHHTSSLALPLDRLILLAKSAKTT